MKERGTYTKEWDMSQQEVLQKKAQKNYKKAQKKQKKAQKIEEKWRAFWLVKEAHACSEGEYATQKQAHTP